MLNTIWVALITIGMVAAVFTGKVDAVTNAALNSGESAVGVALSLLGALAMWSGIMKIAEEAGLIRVIGRIITPVTRRLFPSVPMDHPAMGAILMAYSANILGLGNACTPLSIKAMQEMDKLNKAPGRATDAMCTFVALTMSSLTILPTTIISIRANAGSTDPAGVVGPIFFSTAVATVVALVIDRLLRNVGSIPGKRNK
ncbi:MAG: nucleoside recognition domain-containing protein [Syntrophothermus sp.]